MLESHTDWVHVENNIRDKVSSLVSPVSNDTLFIELKLDDLFNPVLVAFALLSDLHDSFETRLC
jgi:hypothetical protein